MASRIEALIELKTERLSTIPDELLSKIERVQKQVFPQVLELIDQLDRDRAGMILLNDNNLSLLSTITEQLRDVLLNSEYTEAVQEFAEQIEVQAGITDALLASTFKDFVTAGKAADLVALSKRNAISLLNSVDNEFSRALYDTIELAVANNSSWGETVRQIQAIVTGDAETDGLIQRYAKGKAHDTFAIADRSYTSAVSDEIEAEWFFLFGGSGCSK